MWVVMLLIMMSVMKLWFTCWYSAILPDVLHADIREEVDHLLKLLLIGFTHVLRGEGLLVLGKDVLEGYLRAVSKHDGVGYIHHSALEVRREEHAPLVQ